MLLALAARNLLRNPRRTALTLMAVAFGLTLMVFTVNLQNGQYQTMIASAIEQLAGHVVVQLPGWDDDREEADVMEGVDAMVATLGETFPDGIVCPRLNLGGLLSSPTASVAAQMIAMDGRTEAAVSEFDDKLVDGAWLDGDDRGVVIGRAMADRLQVGIGDKVVFMGQWGGDDIDSRLFRVKGIFRTGSPDADGFLVIGPIAGARALLGRDDVAHQVMVHLPGLDPTAPGVAAGVLPDTVEVQGWDEALPELKQMIALDRNSGDIMLSVLGIIIAMGVLNTVLMSVLERTREFGVMRAVGMGPVQLALLVLGEAFVLGCCGAVAGLVCGLLVSWPAVAYGIDFGAMFGQEVIDAGGFTISAVTYAAWDPARMGTYVVGAVALTVLAAIYPAVTVARLQPVEAMRHS